ncbi:MAG: hypothetical protein HY298_04075 [Verrucomicrobia bacterium]|nr:hypothetical protein [Verrucomicrobiota bacterium]
MKRGFKKLRVLLLHLEFPSWSQGRHWPYSTQLSFEEGLRANGIHFASVTTPWLPRVPDMFRGTKFDQVWVEIVHNPLDDAFLDWIASAAPVRVALLLESLEHTPEECQIWPLFATRKKLVESRLRYMTHTMAFDDHDVETINGDGFAPAMWWPPGVPKRFISNRTSTAFKQPAVFSGGLYGGREGWLKRPELKGLMVMQPSAEAGTPYPRIFDTLRQGWRLHLAHGHASSEGR